MLADLLLPENDDDDEEMTAALVGAADKETSSTLSRLYRLGRLKIEGMLPPLILESVFRANQTTQTRPVTGLYIEQVRPVEGQQ